jgi:tetratricopeptide (TPR) repeat protein
LVTQQPGRAEEQFAAAAKLMPESASAWYGLGRSRAALGKSDAAYEAWQHLSALPPSFESHMRAAELHMIAQRWQAAANEWQQTLQLRPRYQPAVLGLGEALYRNRDYEAAMAELKPLVTTGVPVALFLYGGSLMNLQRPADAIPYLRSALAHDPRLLPASAALGQALLQTDKAAEAIPLLQAALSVDLDGGTHFQLFRAYQLTNRKQEARVMLSEYQRLRASLETAR